MGGVDEDGGNVQTCRLVGTYRLTQSMSDEEYAATCAHFPELNIIQPQFVGIKIDQTVGDGEKITNLDNSTGYDYNTEFTPVFPYPGSVGEKALRSGQKDGGG